MSASNKENDELILDFKPGFRVYKDGRFERYVFPNIPPSLEDPKTGVSSKDITLSPEVSARLYLPKLNYQNQKLPILVYFHGGGFAYGSPYREDYNNYMYLLVSEANVVAVSVKYRLVPEHPLPAALEDSWTALQWVASHVNEHANNIAKEPWLINHGDFQKIFVNGDSAGGSIVNNMVLRAGTEKLHGNVKIYGAILAFPFFLGSNPVGSMSSESILQSDYSKFWKFVYPLAPGGLDCPLINPMADGAPSLAQIGCSRMLVITAELDVLRERGSEYVEALKNSKWEGEVELHDVNGEDHCFQLIHLHSERARDFIRRLTDFIKK